MPKKSKPFIDKKSAVTFKLVHRSQRDPLIANEELGDKVLLEEASAKPSSSSLKKKPEKRREEEHKYGVYFDDDDEYDYLQHLRDVNEVYSWGDPLQQRFRINADGTTADAPLASDPDQPSSSSVIGPAAGHGKTNRLNLPSTLFETTGVELETGLLNQAAPRPGPHPGLDPDIIAALDDDFDFEDPDNELEDDFMAIANAAGDGDMEEDSEETRQKQSSFRKGRNGIGSSSDDSDEDSDEESDEDDMSEVDAFGQEETRSRFTQYSMTSSVMRRSEGLQFIDKRFEKLYEKYDPEELAEIDFEDEEEIGGFLEPNSDRMKTLVEDYHESIEKNKNLLSTVLKDKADVFVKEGGKDDEGEEREAKEKIYVDDRDANGERWDCESVLTTYSNLYNRPTLIKEERTLAGRGKTRREHAKITLDKHGNPEGVIGRGLTKRKLQQLDDQPEPMDTSECDEKETIQSRASTVRPKGESTEDRKRRKEAVKAERRERRIEKKANKVAFKEESLKQSKEVVGMSKIKADAVKLM